MPVFFDMTEKPDATRIVYEKVVISIGNHNYSYFMTNDYSILSKMLQSIGCRAALPDDFVLNPNLAKSVRAKMSELKVFWSCTLCNGYSILNYYEANSDTAYIVDLRLLIRQGKLLLPLFSLLAVRNCTKEMQRMLDLGGNINAKDQNGQTALIVAVRANAFASVEYLIASGADVNTQDTRGTTVLMIAVANNFKECVEVLLQCSDIHVNQQNYVGCSALILAASSKDDAILSMLLEHGADSNVALYTGVTALMVAVQANAQSAVKMLLSSGCDIDAKDNFGETALMKAVKANNEIMVYLLLSAGADYTVKNTNGYTVYMLAAQQNNTEILMLLENHSAVSDDDRLTAILKAAGHDAKEAVAFLIQNIQEPKGAKKFALLCAVRNDAANVVALLLSRKCSIDTRFFHGMTALMIAVYSKSQKVLPLLIKAHADLDAVDDNGQSVLMYAASRNNVRAVDALINAGARLDFVDKYGKTYVDYLKHVDKRTFLKMIADNIKKSKSTEANTVSHVHQSFHDKLTYYIQKYYDRYPECKTSDIYKDAGISKQTFSKIQSNKDPSYSPRRNSVIALTIGLRLTPVEAEDLLASAGYVFSDTEKYDGILKQLLADGVYSIDEYNDRLYRVLGKTLNYFEKDE